MSKDWVNCDLKSSNEVQHYKKMSIVKSLLEVRWTLPQAWLQKKLPKHTKGNDNRKAIITKELKSHLEGLL